MQTRFLNVFFKFSWVSEPKFRWFFYRFLDSKRKRRFCKNSAPACTGARFFRFRRVRNQQKINKTSMQNKNEKMIGTNCKKYRFWYSFGKSFGRFWEGLEGIKVRSKKSFFLTSTRGMICLHLGGRWEAKMQPCSPKLRDYFWAQPVRKLLGGGNCFWNQIWKRFGEGLSGF